MSDDRLRAEIEAAYAEREAQLAAGARRVTHQPSSVADEVAHSQQLIADMYRAHAAQHPRASDEAEYMLERSADAEATADRVRQQMDGIEAAWQALYPDNISSQDGRAR